MKKSIAVSLDHWLDRKHGARPLGEVLEEALEILNPNREEYGDITTAPWLARAALRAVLEAIIRTGHFPVPLDVEFTSARRDGLCPTASCFRHSRN